MHIGEFKRKKILIVDDELEMIIMIEKFLRKEGFFVYILLPILPQLCRFAEQLSLILRFSMLCYLMVMDSHF